MEYFLLEDEPILTPIGLLVKRSDDVHFCREVDQTTDPQPIPEGKHFVNVILNCKTIKVC
jgi:hypothetical protein